MNYFGPIALYQLQIMGKVLGIPLKEVKPKEYQVQMSKALGERKIRTKKRK